MCLKVKSLARTGTQLFAVVMCFCGCTEPDVVTDNTLDEATPEESALPDAATQPPRRQLTSEPVTDVTSQLSDDDLGLDEASAGATIVSPPAVSSNNAPPILEEAYEVVERYEDDTVKRRWFVRLYVTFDRAKPWHQQSPGSWVQHGRYEEYYPGGKQLLATGQFHEGKRHGEWTYYHPNGEIAKQGEYHHAQLDGPWSYFRPDGTLQRAENYQAHQRHGTWKHYDSDGQTVLREETYEHDERVASNTQ